jgi:Plasmid pRiA4b ORF-3-like protein
VTGPGDDATTDDGDDSDTGDDQRDPRVLSLTVHHLRVTLLDVTPSVWREIRVPSALPLSTVHAVLQIALGWEDRHLHEWRVGEVTYGLSDEDSWGEDIADESAAVLGEIAAADSVLRYDYDFADGWEHLVEVSAVVPYDGDVAPVACLAGARACPPEDCGGPSGYEHLLDALYDPDDAEHEEVVEWLGDSFDPASFDLTSVNHRLEQLWRAI